MFVCSIQLPFHPVREATLAALRQTDLEWTEVYPGFYLDYYGIPHLQSYMAPNTFVVDIAHKVAAIPGTGDEPLTLTYSNDAAKFVVASLDLPKWDERTVVYGERTTYNKLVKQAEEILGKLLLLQHWYIVELTGDTRHQVHRDL
jgi:nucleoside-diphosphate-sugar epimerase